jgi:hypothetical protein
MPGAPSERISTSVVERVAPAPYWVADQEGLWIWTTRLNSCSQVAPSCLQALAFRLELSICEERRLRPARALAKHLAVLAGLPETTELEDAAEWFVSKLGKDRLVEELQAEFTVKEVAPAHVELLSYPWHRIYTTNYDNVAETAAAQNGKRLTPGTLDDSIHGLPKSGTLCIHLNGFIDNLNPETLNAEIKLTNTSYLTNIVAASPWATTLQQDMDAVRAVFFVGYSTADIDIRRLIYKRPALKDKSFFVIGPQDDPVAAQKISRFGLIRGFNAALAKTAASSSGAAAQTPKSYCMRQFEPTTFPPFEDRFVFDLFLHGDVNAEFAWQSLHGRLDYFVDGVVATMALEAFQSGWRAAAGKDARRRSSVLAICTRALDGKRSERKIVLCPSSGQNQKRKP